MMPILPSERPADIRHNIAQDCQVLAVILSEAKDLMPVANGDEILRCAQDDKSS
jgi:hypothetical protein